MSKKIKNADVICSGEPLSAEALRDSLKPAFAAGAAALIIYLLTMSLGVPCGFDSAELIGVCAVGGVAHSPGYPLYSALGYLLCTVSPMPPALTMNAFSAFCSASACFCLFLSLNIMTRSRFASLVSALLFAFALTPWRMAAGAEVFALHLLFCSLLLLTALLCKSFPEKRKLWSNLLALLLGLSLSHHHMTVLFIPGLAIFLWLNRKAGKTALSWQPALFFALGLLPYLWLPWRANYIISNDIIYTLNWGNPSSWKNFWWTVTRSGYGSLQLSTKGIENADRIASLFMWLRSSVLNQFAVIPFLLGLYGFWESWRRQKDCFLLLGLFWILAGPVWALYAAQPNQDGYGEMMERFFASSYLAFAYFAALGAAVLLSRSGQKYLQALKIGLILCCAFNLCFNWARASEHSLRAVDSTVQVIERYVRDNSIVFVQSDMLCGGMIYAKSVDRRKFVFVPLGLAQSEWFIDSLPEAMGSVLRGKGAAGLAEWGYANGMDVYFENKRMAAAIGLEGSRQSNPIMIINDGLLWRFVREGERTLDSENDLKNYLAFEHRKLNDFMAAYDREQFEERNAAPFWHRFAVDMWRRALKVCEDGSEKDNVLNYEMKLQKAERKAPGR
ncbi:DUF2723 domain-containing protein [bacterium]|nr:DUF2723 domain-containing protein [bacterium]